MNTRKKREGSKRVAFSIHDEMNISKISLKELLSDPSTKADFTRYLSKKLLRRFPKITSLYPTTPTLRKVNRI